MKFKIEKTKLKIKKIKSKIKTFNNFNNDVFSIMIIKLKKEKERKRDYRIKSE